VSKPPQPPMDPTTPPDLADLQGAPVLVDAELETVSVEDVDWSGRDASGLKLSESRIGSSGLAGLSMTRARLRDVVIDGGSLANGTMNAASLSRVRFEDVRLTGASFSGPAWTTSRSQGVGWICAPSGSPS
jgi:uncharacterized protein YjbI with pentapeptide repeats